MLEGVEVDLPVGQRVVRRDVIGELDQLKVDAFLGKSFDGRSPDDLMDGSADTELDDFGRGFRSLFRRTGGKHERRCKKQRKCDKSRFFHMKVLLMRA